MAKDRKKRLQKENYESHIRCNALELV